VPEPPAADALPDAAEALVAELCAVGRDAARRGLVLASAGNLSARLPDGDAFVVTAAGTWFDRLTPDDFAVLSTDGSRIAGHPAPSSEWRLHARTYAVRPDVSAIVHLHPQAAVVLDACGERVRLITLDHAWYLGKVATVPFAHNGTEELAEAAAEAARDSDAIVLSHHGSSTLGPTIEMAWRRALLLEDAALATFRCLSIGDRDAAFPSDAWVGLRHA
jgi:L-fuculose-phosphate aldolase